MRSARLVIAPCVPGSAQRALRVPSPALGPDTRDPPRQQHAVEHERRERDGAEDERPPRCAGEDREDERGEAEQQGPDLQVADEPQAVGARRTASRYAVVLSIW